MKRTELPLLIQELFSKCHDLKVTNSDVVVLSTAQYSDMFWKLLHEQQLAKSKNSESHLIEHLNQYIASNKSDYPANFSIRNPVKLKRPSPPARQSTIEMMQFIEQLDVFFSDSLSDTNRPPIFYLGRLLYCAMRYGGLLRNDFLSDLASKLRNEVPRYYESVVWFELKGTAGEVHIWQPDAMSVQLLNQWYRLNERAVLERGFLYYFSQFQRQASLNLGRKPSVKWWIHAIRARLSLEVTPYSLDIMTGAQPNLTLKAQVFYRLLSKKSFSKALMESVGPDEIANELPKINIPKPLTGRSETNEQLTKSCLKNIKNYLRLAKVEPNKVKDFSPLKPIEISKFILAHLETVKANLPPVIIYLIRWVSVRLISQSRWSGKLTPGSLLSYLDTIAIPIWLSCGDVDPVTMDLDALEEVYDELIDEGPSLTSRTRRAKILRDFHIYLEDQHNVEPCYLFQRYIAQGKRFEALTVDANILMPWEYQIALDFLLNRTEQQTGVSPQHAKALVVLLMLGFRCGLRRREALYLRVSDIENLKVPEGALLSDFATIYITPHQHRTLKTLSAERRVPIGLLLNDAEKNVFNEYLQSRRTLGTENSPYLFYAGSQAPLGAPNRLTISETIMFEPLTTLLQRITGDDTFRFHHLRHSFATWMHWSWSNSSLPDQKAPLCSLNEIPQFSHLVKAKRTLFHHDVGQPTRKSLHLISALIGHAGPSMTLFHYIHSASWTLWMDLNSSCPSLNRTDEAILADVNVRTASRARVGDRDATDVYQGMAAYAANELLQYCDKLQLKGWKDTSLRVPAALNIAVSEQLLELDIYQALICHFNQGKALEDCALAVNVSLARLHAAYQNALIFFAQVFNANSRNEFTKRPRNYKTFTYIDGLRVRIPPIPHLPEIPANPRSFNIAYKMLKIFLEISPDEQAEVMWAAHFVVTRCSVKWPHFRIHDYGLQHRFISAICLFDQAIKVKRQMRFTLVASAPYDSMRRKKRWRSLSLNHFEEQDRQNRSDPDYSIKGHLSIDFKHDAPSSKYRDYKRKARGKTEVQHRRTLSEYGVRFGLYMIFITAYEPPPDTQFRELARYQF